MPATLSTSRGFLRPATICGWDFQQIFALFLAEEQSGWSFAYHLNLDWLKLNITDDASVDSIQHSDVPKPGFTSTERLTEEELATFTEKVSRMNLRLADKNALRSEAPYEEDFWWLTEKEMIAICYVVFIHGGILETLYQGARLPECEIDLARLMYCSFIKSCVSVGDYQTIRENPVFNAVCDRLTMMKPELRDEFIELVCEHEQFNYNNKVVLDHLDAFGDAFQTFEGEAAVFARTLTCKGNVEMFTTIVQALTIQ